MKKVIYYIFAISIAVVTYGFQSNLLPGEEPAGKKIFLASKCMACHSVESAEIILKKKNSKIPDLSMVGTRHNADFITKWIHKEETIDGVKHMYSYKGSDEDLKVLVDWLMSLSEKKADESPKAGECSKTNVDSTLKTEVDSTINVK